MTTQISAVFNMACLQTVSLQQKEHRP